MKKLKYLSMVGIMLVGINGYSQGLVGFTDTTVPIFNSLTGSAAAANLLKVGLYYNLDLAALPDNTGADDSFTQAGLSQAVLAGGIFAGGSRTIPSPAAPGQNVLVQVRAWATSFATYEEAFAAGALIGYSNLMGADPLKRVIMGGGTIATPSIVIQGGLQSFSVAPVPEPSMIALSLLGGLGAMMLLRRRK